MSMQSQRGFSSSPAGPTPGRPGMEREPDKPHEVIYLVDDDQAVREAVEGLLQSAGCEVVAFGSAGPYLAFQRSDSAACLIIDLHLPDMSGLDLQRHLCGRQNPPVIFISGRADIPSTVMAMKRGAREFFMKPLDAESLIEAAKDALEYDRANRARQAQLAELQRRFALLTSREREVLPLVVSGLLNKQAAAVLRISEVTLQIHRSQIRYKMQADSLAHLVRMAAKLGIPAADP